MAVFKVDAEGASLHNASFNLYGTTGGRIDLGSIFGIVGGADKNTLFYYDSKGQPTGVRTSNGRSISRINNLYSNETPNANFWIDMYGDVYLKGKIAATAGSIGGWEIASSYLYSGSGSTRVALNGGTSNYSEYAMWAGNENPSYAPFWVKKNGDFYARNGTFSGTLSAANISGTLTANSGAEIVGAAIYVPSKTNPKFKVDSNGNVTMQGNINMDGNLNLGNGIISWNNLNSSVKSEINGANTTASNALTTAKNASTNASSAETLARRIANGEFSNGTFIDGRKIYSPEIYSNSFRVMPRSQSGDNDGYSLYAYFGSSLYRMLHIYYQNDIPPAVVFNNDSRGTINFESEMKILNGAKFTGKVDFSNATVVGLSTSNTATFG